MKFLIILIIFLLTININGKCNEIDSLLAVIMVYHTEGVTQYTHRMLYTLKRADTASYRLVLRLYHSKKNKIDVIKPLKQQFNTLNYKALSIKKVEFLSDDFGNTAIIYYYQNGYKSIIGDIIVQGKSYREIYKIK